MKLSVTKKTIWLVLTIFIISMLGSAVQAASKHEMYEVSQKIKQLNEEIRLAYIELRKLNEEGGPEAQVEAQKLMEKIQGHKADVYTLKAVLKNMKNKVRK
ncbi:MAG: hypothetical protein ACQETH_11885 [Candidatus Rifleibacteriota bacterium]